MPAHTHSSPFPTTHWTQVHAVQQGSPEAAREAMEEICKRYWYPIYAFLRRSGRSAPDAQDITQSFFAKLLEEDALHTARKECGRLRSYLIGMLKRLMADQARHDGALKRGGRVVHVSFDELGAGERYEQEPLDSRDPEQLYDRAWAVQMLDSVREKLRQSFTRKGRLELYETLEPYFDVNDAPAPYAELAVRIASNEAAVRVLVHRLRRKFRDLLVEEISCTVLNAKDVDAELAWLREVLK